MSLFHHPACYQNSLRYPLISDLLPDNYYTYYKTNGGFIFRRNRGAGSKMKWNTTNRPFSFVDFAFPIQIMLRYPGSICFHNWTFSCSHVVVLMNTTKVQTSLVSSHDLYWEKVSVAPTGKASFVYSCVQTRLRAQCNGKWLFGLVFVLKPPITVIRAIGINRVDEGQISTLWKVQR